MNGLTRDRGKKGSGLLCRKGDFNLRRPFIDGGRVRVVGILIDTSDSWLRDLRIFRSRNIFREISMNMREHDQIAWNLASYCPEEDKISARLLRFREGCSSLDWAIHSLASQAAFVGREPA